jgi:hypothetical protein
VLGQGANRPERFPFLAERPRSKQLTRTCSSRHEQKRQIGFEAVRDGVPVARSARSGLGSVSTHRSQRGGSTCWIGSEMLLLVGHPGLGER